MILHLHSNGCLIALLCFLGAPSNARAGPASDAAAAKPNIVFILADDLGWRDLGCQGSTFYETPHIDALAAGGMRFTDAYAACPVCSPTRASILTGKYPARLQLTDWIPGGPGYRLNPPPFLHHLPLEETTIARFLKDAGYATAIFGKWHLGGPRFYPENFGFDVNVGGCERGSPPSYFSPYNIPNLPDGPKGEYLTDRLTDETLKFIEARKDVPFFIYLAHYAVHIPLQAKPELLAKYRAKASALPPLAGPEYLPEGTHRARQVQNLPVYAAMVQSVDDSVGRVLQRLDELGLAKHTIVVFTSDNGGLSTAEGAPTSNVPLRGGKGWLFEGGVREPLIVRWPGVTKSGSVTREPIISTDYFSTLAEMAGLKREQDPEADGISIVSALRGAVLPERPLFWHYPHYSPQGGGPGGAVRLGDFKLIEWYDGDGAELYDLRNDIGERHDLSADMPDRAAAMRRTLHEWRKSVRAAMPTTNPSYIPATQPQGDGGAHAAAPAEELDDN